MRLRHIIGTSAILTALIACGDDPTFNEPPAELPRNPVASATVLVTSAEGPLADAGIVIEALDGAIVEQTTGADGSVDLLVPVDQIRSILAHRDGHSFAALTGKALVTGMDRSAGVQLHLDTLATTPMAAINGVAWNMKSDDSWLVVSSTLPGSTYYQGKGNQFHLEVPANRPFELIGLDWEPAPGAAIQTFFGWTATASLGVHDAFINLDFAQSLAGETVEGSFYVPPTSELEIITGAYAVVSSYESQGGLFLGAPTSLELNNRFVDITATIGEARLPNGWHKDTRPPVVDFPYAMADQAEQVGVTPHSEFASRLVGDTSMPVAFNPVQGVQLDAPGEGMRANYTIDYLPLEGVTMMTQYYVWTNTGTVGLVEKGGPIAGHSGLEVPDSLTVQTQPPPSLHEGVTWDGDAVAMPYAAVDVFDEAGTRIGWMMGNAEEGAAHCPPLPSTSTDAVFEGELKATVMACQPSTDLPGWCGAFASSNAFDVVP